MHAGCSPQLKFACRHLRCGWLFVLAILASSGCALAPTAPQSQQHLARVEVLALLQTLNADLLSHDSATLTLERWCAGHHLAGNSPSDQPRIIAQRVRGEVKRIPTDLRERLAVKADDTIGYRRVQLTCGTHVLSEADNWYVPSRLTAEMNQRLDTTDEPFGKVVKALGFQRRTLSAELLWSPLPSGWEMSAANSARDADREPLRIPHALLRHKAILYTSAQVPFSAVVETYTNRLFDFGVWASTLAAGQ